MKHENWCDLLPFFHSVTEQIGCNDEKGLTTSLEKRSHWIKKLTWLALCFNSESRQI